MRPREQYLSEAIRWCALSVGWAAIAGVSAVVAGLAARAVALVGFGADSIVDGLASAVLVWRFGYERSRGHDVDVIEHRAARIVGAVLIAIGLYVGVGAVLALAGHAAPDSSPFGLALTAASAAILPMLARAKLRLAGPLRSPALRGDGVLSLAGAFLAAITLVSLALNAGFGWWWSDAVAAIAIAAFLLREGWRTSRPRSHALVDRERRPPPSSNRQAGPRARN
jgi:divalent metal cation (Fe/Co/Zn/Cd) transporter